MPVNPKKLAAFAGNKGEPKKRPLPVKKKRPVGPEDTDEELLGAAADEDDDELEGEFEGEDEHEESLDEDEIAEGNTPTGPTNPSAVIPFMEQYADEIEACCDELDYDVLIDPDLEMSEEDEVIMQEGAAMLPPRLAGNLWHLTDIDYEAALAIGTHLEEEGKSQDAERTAGWIYRIGQALASDSDEEEPIPDEAYEDEFEDESESGLTA